MDSNFTRTSFVNLVVGVFIVITRCILVHADVCSKTSACSCQYSDGSKVDLSPLISDTEDPMFREIPDNIGLDKYYWNPCKAFTLEKCENVAVCDAHQNIPSTAYFSLGTQKSAQFSVNSNGQLQIGYQFKDGDVTRSATIVLTCHTGEGQLLASGEDSPGSGTYCPASTSHSKPSYRYSGKSLLITHLNSATISMENQMEWPLNAARISSRGFFNCNHSFELKSKHACKSDGWFSGPSDNLSVGSMLCIIFFALVGVYLIVGIIFQIFVKKNSGTNVLPNSEFWFGLPGLIKDGALFVLRGGKGSQYSQV